MKFKTRYARPQERRLRFEALEGRQMLAVTLDLGSSVVPAPLLDPAGLRRYVDVSQQALDMLQQALSSTTMQTEMMLDATRSTTQPGRL